MSGLIKHALYDLSVFVSVCYGGLIGVRGKDKAIERVKRFIRIKENKNKKEK